LQYHLSTSGKIRLLLALLFASLLFTAIVVQSTYTPVKNLDQTAKMLEDNLHSKEKYINNTLNDPNSYNKLKSLQNKPGEALNFITRFTTDKSIWLITLKKDSLVFWSGVKVIPARPGDIKEGVSFVSQPNGYYEAIKKSEGNFSAIFFFTIKTNYSFQNQYLQNKFAPDLLEDDNIQIADFTDANVYAVHSSINKAYLFSVKLKPGQVNHRFFYFELVSWLLTFFTLCVLIHAICKYLVSKGYVILSLFLLGIFLIGVRFFNLHYNWPAFMYGLGIFNAIFYSSSSIYPSLGDFCLNLLFITWFVTFLYRQRDCLLVKTPGKFTAYLLLFGCIAVLLLTSTTLLNLFYSLVINSKVSFDIYNVFNLSFLSLLGLLMLCFSFLIFYLLNETFLFICVKLPIKSIYQLTVFIVSILIATAIATWYQGFTLFYLLLAIPVLIRAYAYWYSNGQVSATSFIFIVLICAFISLIRFYQVESVKETQTRKALIQKLEVPDDATADFIFKKIEKQVITDPLIIQYFNDTLKYGYLKDRLQKVYFDGYLSKYAYNIHEFNANGQSLLAEKNFSLDIFKDLVLYSSFKVSDYFYRENESFGVQHYFAILPIVQKNRPPGTIVVELRSKPLQPSGSFPDLLKDGEIKQENQFKDYSYAFYIDNKLLSKGGDYVYDLVNTFQGQVKKYTTETTHIYDDLKWYKDGSSFSHLVYKPSERTLIVVSKEEDVLFYSITSLIFFFILLLAFSFIIISIRWLWLRIKILNISDNHLKWIFKISFDRILYKTRIQFSIIAAVVITLIFVGFITFLSISTQYNTQQDDMIRDKISRISAAFESGVFDKYINRIKDENQVDFDELANTYSTDLVLYDRNGVPLITTQPKIYDAGLMSRRMNARAYIALSKFQKSEFINNEVIGGLQYKAVYAPLINTKTNVTVAYLQLPYFSDQADYNSRIVSLLNVMINVYALIFIIVGLFAVIIARQITTPLSFIQSSLSKIIYGKKNEPIIWERDDEIGALVKEYNRMIAALENSAQRLAQSERESAWREMAKQVAHEIKNPLTPLKLGLQLLEKSWRDKDPKFDQKFERFSKSFVEQIESLSSIASEFSSFAKMPDTNIERINIFDMLGQAVTIFVHADNIKIAYQAPEKPFYINADRDQLLRCFNNLLKNAIEATPHDKEGLIDINYLITSKNILLSIKDNGNGIPENMREKIFEPNFTTKSSGTGLGLAFVKNSIENAGGKVWFETVVGAGTTFYLSLPAAGDS
jgi:two-component system nitrogen regulation sensor histidine kinase NtrY